MRVRSYLLFVVITLSSLNAYGNRNESGSYGSVHITWGGLNFVLCLSFDNWRYALCLARTIVSYRYFLNKYFCISPTISIFGDMNYLQDNIRPGGFFVHLNILSLKLLSIGWSYNGAGTNKSMNKTYKGGGVEISIPIGVIVSKVGYNTGYNHTYEGTKLIPDLYQFGISLILFEMIKTNGFYLKIDAGNLSLGLTVGYDFSYHISSGIKHRRKRF